MALCKGFRALLWLLPLAAITQAAAVPASPNLPTYDVLIIGGGPAGLASAMSLGRVGRSALLFDSAEYRNAATQEVHDVIGYDGVAPAAFRSLAREQIQKYPSVMLMNATIVSISGPDHDGDNDGSFIATSSTGGLYSGRRIVLATGMKDILPPTPGLKDIWGKGIYWCSWCDGYEHRGRRFGNLVKFNAATVNSTIALAQTIDPDAIILSNGSFTSESKIQADKDLPDWAQRLQLYNVTVEDRTIKSFGRVKGNMSDYHGDILVTFDDGKTLVRNGIKASFPAKLASNLPSKMGLNLTESDDHEIKVQVDENMESSRQGVHAVGDANSDGSSNVPHAMWSAKTAVVFIHGSLGKEYANKFVAEKSLQTRGLAVDATFDAMKAKIRRRSRHDKPVARQWVEWLQDE